MRWTVHSLNTSRGTTLEEFLDGLSDDAVAEAEVSSRAGTWPIPVLARFRLALAFSRVVARMGFSGLGFGR